MGFDILNMVYSLPAVLLAITFHEYAHAKAADLMGDDTPFLQGRLSLSPLDHIDWIGLLMFIIVGFGWGKPVQINPSKLKNKRWGETIVSIVGPLTNLAIAIIVAPIYMLVVKMPYSPAIEVIIIIFYKIFYLNLIFCFINLLPIPPLDGYRILRDFFFVKNPKFFILYEKYGFIGLMLLIFTGATSWLIGAPTNALARLITGFFSLLGL